jgi:hypothetical protein
MIVIDSWINSSISFYIEDKNRVLIVTSPCSLKVFINRWIEYIIIKKLLVVKL